MRNDTYCTCYYCTYKNRTQLIKNDSKIYCLLNKVSRNIFEHLHQLDLQFHLDRNTGALSRTIDRGTRSINFALTAMLFNVFPTALEVLLVSGLLTYNLGAEYAVVATATIATYTLFTVKVSNWRTG